jgi:hypothetical protein
VVVEVPNRDWARGGFKDGTKSITMHLSTKEE